MREKHKRERERERERERDGELWATNICLDVLVGLLGWALDVHAMAPGVVQLPQLHEVEHLEEIAPRRPWP
jgi:hypothetical protein